MPRHRPGEALRLGLFCSKRLCGAGLAAKMLGEFRDSIRRGERAASSSRACRRPAGGRDAAVARLVRNSGPLPPGHAYNFVPLRRKTRRCQQSCSSRRLRTQNPALWQRRKPGCGSSPSSLKARPNTLLNFVNSNGCVQLCQLSSDRLLVLACCWFSQWWQMCHTGCNTLLDCGAGCQASEGQGGSRDEAAPFLRSSYCSPPQPLFTGQLMH